jgi:hypothetical protein
MDGEASIADSCYRKYLTDSALVKQSIVPAPEATGRKREWSGEGAAIVVVAAGPITACQALLLLFS